MAFDTSLDVAIIGIGARAPHAPSVDALWRNVVDGRECITFFEEHQLEANHGLLGNPHFVLAAGLLGGIDQFDAAFFGLTPRDAELMDPQHRLFLECAWEAVEDAGYDISTMPRNVSVYGGQGGSEYLPGGPWDATLASALPECERVYLPFSSHVTTRVSHALGLTGESVEVRAACATGLVALKLGCRSLLCGDADLSLVGTTHVFIPERRGYLCQDNAFRFSPDGHCRAFDRRANGLVHTSAVGVLLLKRLDDAIRDRDTVYAVVKGIAVNNDGGSRVTYVTPGLERQAECVAEAHLAADVPVETITYVEAHGIAVPMADAIEVEAMRRAFAAQTRHRRFCALGTVKSNLGHSVASAGMMGLIKTALAVKHGVIPPQINFDGAHPNLNLHDSPFVINRSGASWEAACGVRRAGVHSFGMGGTNAHAVLEEAPSPSRKDDSSKPRLVVLSARSPAALDAMRRRLLERLSSSASPTLGDVAFTLAVGRKAQPHRWAAVGDREEIRGALTAGIEGPEAISGDAPLRAASAPPLRVAGRPGDREALRRLASAWTAGHSVDWPHLFDGEARGRVPLPTYPFQRQRHWLEDLHRTEGEACG